MMNKRIDGKIGFPAKHGLYDPAFEKDSCGVGFVAHVKGIPSHEILTDAYHINSRMDHRGGCGFEENTGDGAGIMTVHARTNSCRRWPLNSPSNLGEAGVPTPPAIVFPAAGCRPCVPNVESHLRVRTRVRGRPHGTRLAGSSDPPGRGGHRPRGSRDAMPFIEQVIVSNGTLERP